MRTWPRLSWFALGVLVAAVAFYVIFMWPRFARDVFWAPWLAVPALAIARIRLGPVVRPVAFVLGVLTVYVLTMGTLLARPDLGSVFNR